MDKVEPTSIDGLAAQLHDQVVTLGQNLAKRANALYSAHGSLQISSEALKDQAALLGKVGPIAFQELQAHLEEMLFIVEEAGTSDYEAIKSVASTLVKLTETHNDAS